MLPVILAVAGCGGFFTLIQFLIQRYDSRRGELKAIRNDVTEIRKEIRMLDDKGDRREAVDCRVRILRFEDELQEMRRHSKDSFDQVMTDITTYDHYCDQHPEFKNSQTVATVEHIKKVYVERLDKHDFL